MSAKTPSITFAFLDWAWGRLRAAHGQKQKTLKHVSEENLEAKKTNYNLLISQVVVVQNKRSYDFLFTTHVTSLMEIASLSAECIQNELYKIL